MLYRKWTRTFSGAILENILPRPKLFKRREGRINVFMKWPDFMLEVGFGSPRFYCMPKKRAGFIIATYEGKVLTGDCC